MSQVDGGAEKGASDGVEGSASTKNRVFGASGFDQLCMISTVFKDTFSVGAASWRLGCMAWWSDVFPDSQLAADGVIPRSSEAAHRMTFFPSGPFCYVLVMQLSCTKGLRLTRVASESYPQNSHGFWPLVDALVVRLECRRLARAIPYAHAGAGNWRRLACSRFANLSRNVQGAKVSGSASSRRKTGQSVRWLRQLPCLLTNQPTSKLCDDNLV